MSTDTIEDVVKFIRDAGFETIVTSVEMESTPPVQNVALVGGDVVFMPVPEDHTVTLTLRCVRASDGTSNAEALDNISLMWDRSMQPFGDE